MKGWFTVRERLALLAFLPLAGLFALLCLLLEPRPRPEEAAALQRDLESRADSASLFPFDPNTADYAALRRLGLTAREAAGLLRYRAAGKRFRIPEDVATCYEIGDSLYAVLAPYIRIGSEYAFAPRGNTGRFAEHAGARRREIRPFEPFGIDTVGADYLVRIGFTERQARAVVRYRLAVGSIRDLRMLAACFVVGDSVAELLAPYALFPAGESGEELLELNGADSAALRGVIGIGEKTVAAILDYRRRLGGFHSVAQLSEVRGVTESNFERIVQQIYCDSCKIQKIDINFASPDKLRGHPYLPPATLRKLLSKRQLKGGWRTVEELIDDHIITRREALRLAPYLRFTETTATSDHYAATRGEAPEASEQNETNEQN